MTKSEKRNGKIKVTITRTVVVSLIINTLFILVNVLIVSGLFFFQQVTSIYDDLNKAIVGEAYTQIDDDLIKDLANTTHGVYRGLDKPQEMFRDNKEEYYGRFTEITKNPKYIALQNKLKLLCSATQASEIDIFIRTILMRTDFSKGSIRSRGFSEKYGRAGYIFSMTRKRE